VNAPRPERECQFEVLNAEHDRKSFTCGNSDLDSYLQKQARQDRDRGVAVPYVLVPVDSPTEIVGFYTLSSTGLPLSDMPPDVIKRLPRYPTVGATLLGRLAVSVAHRGVHRGEQLLIDALDRSLAASARVGSVAVVVDAKDADGVRFYEKYGFTRFPEQQLRLFIMMSSIEQLLRSGR